MFRSRRLALGVFVALVAAAAIGTTAVQGHGDRHHHGKSHGHHRGAFRNGFPPNVDRFNLDGYKIETNYTLGRNTGNTFDQTYGATQVQGVPVKGPAVGTVFPPVNYVALQIAPKTLYVCWLSPSDNSIVDAFVMNFKTHAVFDYAPGSTSPESSGTVKILQKGSQRIR
jgi:hypothetical protein